MKRIGVLTTNGVFPLFIQAVFDKGLLTFGDVERLSAPREKLRAEALARLPKLIKRGDTIIIDEYSGSLAKECGAKNITLSMKGPDDIPVIVKSFGLYHEMKRQHAILLPANNPGAYEVPNTLVNEVHNANGELSYQVDWENIRSEQYLTLLTVYATTFNDVGSADYIRRMMNTKGEEKSITSPLQAIIEHQQKEGQKGMPESLAGKKIDDNTWIL